MGQQTMKQNVAKAALAHLVEDEVIGIGTGSTVNCFIELLSAYRNKIEGAVTTSHVSAEKLKAAGIRIVDLNSVVQVPVYFDGADEVNPHKQMIKGGGGALTQEKIVASASKKFICMIDESKQVTVLSEKHPVPIEVIPCARSFVARAIRQLGGDPEYRESFVTDNGNVILDIYHFEIQEPIKMEELLNQIPGVVSNGIFAKRPADVVLVASKNGVVTTQ